jgi:hypothetical protein
MFRIIPGTSRFMKENFGITLTSKWQVGFNDVCNGLKHEDTSCSLSISRK